eukprot:2374057-Pyramimonas_sp.AAC.1
MQSSVSPLTSDLLRHWRVHILYVMHRLFCRKACCAAEPMPCGMPRLASARLLDGALRQMSGPLSRSWATR